MNVTTEEIKSWQKNEDGQYVDPEGRGISIGRNVIIGDDVTIGGNVIIGDNATIGGNATIKSDANMGDDVTIKRGAIIGGGVRLGDGVKLGDWVTIGCLAYIGDGATISDYSIISTRVEIARDVKLNRCVIPVIDIYGYNSNPYAPGTLRIGCEVHTVDDWLANLPEIMAQHSIEPVHESTIRAQIEWLAGWFDAYPDAMS